ncbi:LysR family transcriptional regulator [Actinosynnema sp. CS-041913]|uniref:LysR family transcriptional regulator n=1 Tax=Actinosynnema sp. CS-041913 TaxID=3239917 RepID=UPI003D90A776
MRLDVHHLRVVRAIADTESLSRAAAVLGITQPAVSAQLKRLEQLLGYRLFERREGTVLPTPMGELLLRRTTAVLPQLDKLLEDIDQCSDRGRPPARMRVGAVCSAVVPHLSAVVTALWPEVREVSLVNDASDRLLSLVDERRVELATVKDYPGHELPVPRDVDTAVVVVEPTFVLLPEQHPLAARGTVDLADLKDEGWVVVANDSSSAAFNELFAETCARHGFVPVITHLVSSQTVAQLVVRTGAVGLVQPACDEHAGIAVRALRGDLLRRRHILAWHRETFVAERTDELLAAVVDAYWAEARRSSVYRRYLSS